MKKDFVEDDIDIIGSIEFDLSESLKDLIYQIKSIRKDVNLLKTQIKHK